MWILWLLAALLWFGALGGRDLVGTDEGRYSEISREMALSGDYVTPRLNGLKYFEKPAFQYWMSALAFQAFGESEFVARLWTGLAGFLSVLMVAYTARRLWGMRAGQYAGLVAVSTVWLFGVAHVVTVDMSVSLFLTVALCGFLIAQDDATPEASRRRWMLLVWAAMAGGVLSKGLIGAVIPGATLFFYSLLTRDWKPWTRMEWLRGAALFFLLAAPWFVLVSMRNQEFFEFFFIHEHFTRFSSTVHRRTGAWHYFIPILLGGLLPWTSLLPQLLRQGWRGEVGRRFQPDRMLLVWCVFIFLFFSLSGSKLPGYILPMFPALALLIARTLIAAPAQALQWHAVAVIVLWIGVLCYAPVFYRSGENEMWQAMNQAFTWWVVAAVAVMIVFALLAFRAAKQQQQAASVALISSGGLLMAVVLIFGYQVFAPMTSAKTAARLMQPYIQPDTEVFSIGIYEQGLPFYLKRTITLVNYVDEFNLGQTAEPHKWIPTVAEFPPRWHAAKSAVAITDSRLYEQFVASGLPVVLIHQDSKRVLFRKP